MASEKKKKRIANERADELRRRLTRAERYFKSIFEKTKIPIKSQKIVYNRGSYFIIDFFVPSKFLCIEVDGGYHDELKQKERDQKRDKYLLDHKYEVWRLTNKEAFALTKEDILTKLAEYPDRGRGKIRILPLGYPKWKRGKNRRRIKTVRGRW